MKINGTLEASSTVVSDVLAVNYLMRRPVTQDETERVVHALGLANYAVVRRAPSEEK